MNASDQSPPQGGRHRLRELAGLFGAPLAWVLQMSICEPLAANSCIDDHARSLSAIWPAFWHALQLTLKLLSLLFLAAGLLCGLTARNMWRDAKRQGAGDGRPQFLAKLALMSSFVFIVAIAFTACAAFLVAPCLSN